MRTRFQLPSFLVLALLACCPACSTQDGASDAPSNTSGSDASTDISTKDSSVEASSPDASTDSSALDSSAEASFADVPKEGSTKDSSIEASLTDVTTDLPDTSEAEATDSAAQLDSHIDGDAEGGAPNLGFECIKEWPDYTAATPITSLPGPQMALIGIETNGDALQGASSFWGGRLGITGGNLFWSYDVATGTWSKFSKAASTAQFLGPPAARRDVPGGFVLGGVGVAALQPDFLTPNLQFPSGIAWMTPLGLNVSSYYETTNVSPMLVHPDGTIFLTATDGQMRALRHIDGSNLWIQPLAFDAVGKRKDPNFGIGDRIFVGGAAYDRKTGTSYAIPRFDGQNLQIVAAAYGRRLLAIPGQPVSEHKRMVLLDECGNHMWTLPELASYDVIVGFGDNLTVSATVAGGASASYVYSLDGKQIAGPGPGFASLIALGADGVSYVANCVPSQTNGSIGDLEVVALSPNLTELARLNVGDSCMFHDGVLLDNGQLLIPRMNSAAQIQLVKIATSSPGLAKTAWPTLFHDNARTGWISNW